MVSLYAFTVPQRSWRTPADDKVVADEAAKKPTYEELEGRVASLTEQLARALERIEELERAGKRRAAPFGKGKPKKDPKPPGRKSGDDYGKWRCALSPRGTHGGSARRRPPHRV